MNSNSDGMTRQERADLAQLVRRREKLAKANAKQRAAELMADVEQQLAAQHKADDERWRDITARAEAAVAEADAEVAQICREAGVPESFRPGHRPHPHAQPDGQARGRLAVAGPGRRRQARSRPSRLGQGPSANPPPTRGRPKTPPNGGGRGGAGPLQWG